MFRDQVLYSGAAMVSKSTNSTILPRDSVSLLSPQALKQTTQNDRNASNEPSKPKRPLSAYNLFFKHEREQILAKTPVRSEGKPRRSHGKIGFGSLARTIADKWNNIDDETRDYFEDLAAEDKARYKQEKKKWKKATMTENKSAKGGQNTVNEQLASVLKGVLDDTIHDITSFQDPIQTCSGSLIQRNQTKHVDGDINSSRKDQAEKETRFSLHNTIFVNTKDAKSKIQTMEQVSSSLNANYTSSALLGNKCVLKQTKPFSLLGIAPKMPFPQIGPETNSSAMEDAASQKNKTSHIAELAAKLDEECMNFICSWQQE